MSPSVLHVAICGEGGEGATTMGIDPSSMGTTPFCDFIRIGLDPLHVDISRKAGHEAIDLLAPVFIGGGHAILAESDSAIIVGRLDPQNSDHLSLFHDDFPSLVSGDSMEGSPFRRRAERAALSGGAA